ncbi:tetratricopeptide repeat protein [Shewanella gelidimarina]|uniref:tetratricopeptide repeat protein n=1 Tax=Shewanella gelidimarina TaxID=56813 RepID=UPI00200D3BAA|nr:tetratricopeptide repeat protein [Shewanella gelidimarina]MCL1057125.1 tetratricopeptide repeat protein [Shewanella gelidimarina]
MSVINKMLKDLDKRQQPHGIESMAKPQNALIPQRQSKLPLVVTSLLSLLIGGFIVFFVIEPSNPSAIDNLVTNEQSELTSDQIAGSLSDSEHMVSSTAQSLAVDTQEALSDKEAVTPAPATRIVNVNNNQPTAKPELVPSAVNTAKAIAEVTDENTARNNPEAKTTTANTSPSSQPVRQQASSMSIEPAKRATRTSYSSSNMAIKEVKLTSEQLAQKQMILANDAQQQGLHSDALTYYKAALSYNPALHQARKQAAALYYGQNKLSESAQLLKQGQLLFPDEYEYSLLLARVLQAAGQNKQALSSLNLIPDTSELAVKKWHQQSDLAQKEQNFPVAEQSFRQLAKNEPSQGRWWMGLGYALDAQKNYTEAKNAYNQALAQGNLSSQAQAYVDNRLVQLGAFQ